MTTDTLEQPAAATDTGGYIWYELMTPDAAAAKAFYDDVIGWNIDEHNTVPGGGPVDYRMINRADGGFAGGLLVLTDEMRAHGARPIWVGYLHVADVDATLAAIEADGGRTLMPARDMDGVGRMAMVTDPQGVPFYIMTPTPPADRPDARSDVFDPAKAGHVRWNELATSDQDGAIAFYEKHFGWQQKDSMPMGELGDYKFIWHDGVMIGAVMRKFDASPASAWTTYFGVDDIDRAFTAATERGATTLYEPREIPGGEFSAALVDPQGAQFGLVGPRK